MRRLSPLGILLTYWPVWFATHCHGGGFGIAHRADTLDGQTVPLFGPYALPQPNAISSSKRVSVVSQSRPWLCEPPPAKRSSTIGSFTSRAPSSPGGTPILTTRSCVQVVSTALQRWIESAPATPPSKL